MTAVDTLDALVELLEADLEVESRADGGAAVWLVPLEYLALRPLDDETWQARWRVSPAIEWTHEAGIARDAIAEVVSRRIGWGWGFAGELLLIKRVAAAVAHLPPFSAAGDSPDAASAAGLTTPSQGAQTSPCCTREQAVAAEVV